MSVLMGHTKWPNNHGQMLPSQTSPAQDVTLSQSSKGAVIQGSKAIDSQSHDAISDRDSQGVIRSSPAGRNQRPASGLFDILYDQSPLKSHLITMSSDLTSEKLKSPSYIEIEKAILAGHAVGGSTDNSYAHTVTMIEDNNLRRTGSIVSKEAGLRHRNTIKRRNKIMKRHAMDQNVLSDSSVFSEDSKSKKAKQQRSKLLSIFPVKRRTSYKYYPVQKIDSKSNFNYPEDVDKYFLLNNITSLMKDILPSTMSTFEFKKLHYLRPFLESHPARFAISRDAQFTKIKSQLGERKRSKVSFKEAQFETNHSTSRSIDKSGSTKSEDPDFARRKLFLEEVHANYRRISFAGKRNIPLKLETVLPLESEMMTAAERDTVNTQFLLEILLRRTLSAKIDFRLGQARSRNVRAQRNSSFSSAPSHSSSSSQSETKPEDRTEDFTPRSIDKSDEHDDHPKSKGWSADGPSEFSSKSEFLPSPQISLTSKLFDVHPLSLLLHRNDTHSEPSQNVPHIIAKPIQENDRRTSYSASSKISRFPFSSHTLPSSISIGNGSGESKKVRNYSSYDYEKYSRNIASDCAIDDYSLGNVNLALLQPLNRSQETISSISSGGVARGGGRFFKEKASKSWSASASSFASCGNQGASISSPNTSFSRDSHLSNSDRPGLTKVASQKYISDCSFSRSQRYKPETLELSGTERHGIIVGNKPTSYMPEVN